MAAGIEQPYTLAHLPKPLDSDHGQILAAPVYSLSSSKKRKRHEVAVAVDGESISIYNTQKQSVSTSYPLPPQAYLAAPPCSIYCKARAKSIASQRHTFFAARDAPRDQKLRIFKITENLSKPLGQEREPRVPSKTDIKLGAGNVVGLDVVHGHDGTGGSLIVTHQNGNVDCFADDLSGKRWGHKSTSESTSVEYASVVDFALARKGLLKGRADILAILDPSPNTAPANDEIPLLVQLMRNGSLLQIRVSALRNVRGDPLQDARSPLRELVVYEIPEKHGPGKAKYELHPGTGILYQCLGRRLNIFDLSGMIPRLVAELGGKNPQNVDSFVRLSSTIVLTADPQTLSVCETKFGSVLNSLEYQSTAPKGSASSLQIVSQFVELGIVVALSGNSLAAFRVDSIRDKSKHNKEYIPKLIDVLGKGSRLERQSGLEMSKKQLKRQQRWHEWKSKVDALIEDGDMHELESLMAEELRLGVKHAHAGGDASPNGVTNGISDHSEDENWDLPPHSYDPAELDQRQAIYILGSLFTWSASDEPSHQKGPKLHLKFVPKNILRWLTMAGYMTCYHIEKVLQKSAIDFETRPRAVPGDVMSALKEADPSFTLMYELLALPVQWDLEEVVQGLQILVQSFEGKTHRSEQALLTDGSNGDVVMTEDHDEEARVRAEVDAATKQLDEAENLLETGLENRSGACQLLFYRLHTFPQAEISRTLRAVLSQDELIFFIAILRLELGDAGWTRTYIESDPEAEGALAVTSMENPPDLEPSNQAVRTIADLCSCAIDAIGLSGWLVGLSGDRAETARIITETRNEVTAAAEGLVGVDVVHTMIAEMIKTAGSVQRTGHQLKRRRPDEEDMITEDIMLPLGGRVAPPPLKTKRSQGEVKSKRVLELEKSRSVGKYSFERIRF